MKRRASASAITCEENPNMTDRLQNFIDGTWSPSTSEQTLNVINPASTQVLAQVPLSPAADVNKAADCAARAFIGWRRTPVGDRIQPLFKLKSLRRAWVSRPHCAQTPRSRKKTCARR